MIKKKDKYATDEDILKKNKSVLSNQTLESLEKKSESTSKKEETEDDTEETTSGKQKLQKPDQTKTKTQNLFRQCWPIFTKRLLMILNGF